MTAPIGHNQPGFTKDALVAIRRGMKQFVRRKRELLRAAAKVQMRDRHDAGAAADLLGIARDVRDLVDAERREVVDPLDKAVKAGNARVRQFWEPVDDAMRVVKAQLDDFARAEEKRIADQHREQEAEMERRRASLQPSAAAPAPPPPSPGPQVAPAGQVKRRAFRGDYGRQAIVSDVDEIEIEDWRQLPEWVFQAAAVREAIIKVVKPMVAQKITVPGLKVTAGIKTSVRS